VADRERALIHRDLAAGKSVAQIKADMVATYGKDVLAQPSGGGFDLTAWLLPALLALAAAGALIVVLRRWRGAPSPAGVAAAPALDPADARRLEADLAAHDR
jgi:cytochrome c-type biogenesis protein CcmH/NrfF